MKSQANPGSHAPSTPGPPSRPMRILILRPAALGDTLMLAPALSAMQGLAEVSLVGRNPGLDLLKPYLLHGIDFDSPGWHHLFMEGSDEPLKPFIPPSHRVVAFLKDPQGLVERNLGAWLPGAAVRLFEGYPSYGDKTHVALYLARCLESAGAPVEPEKAIEEAFLRPLLGRRPSSEGEGKILFHPGSGGRQKNHGPGFWIAMIRMFRHRLLRHARRLVILLGPAEEEDLHLYRGEQGCEGVQVLLSPDMQTLTEVLRGAALYIGHDSGITHLAAMMGTPTIALFRTTSVQQWKPLGPDVTVIEERESGPPLLEKVMMAAEGFLGKTKT